MYAVLIDGQNPRTGRALREQLCDVRLCCSMRTLTGPDARTVRIICSGRHTYATCAGRSLWIDLVVPGEAGRCCACTSRGSDAILPPFLPRSLPFCRSSSRAVSHGLVHARGDSGHCPPPFRRRSATCKWQVCHASADPMGRSLSPASQWHCRHCLSRRLGGPAVVNSAVRRSTAPDRVPRILAYDSARSSITRTATKLAEPCGCGHEQLVCWLPGKHSTRLPGPFFSSLRLFAGLSCQCTITRPAGASRSPRRRPCILDRRL